MKNEKPQACDLCGSPVRVVGKTTQHYELIEPKQGRSQPIPHESNTNPFPEEFMKTQAIRIIGKQNQFDQSGDSIEPGADYGWTYHPADLKLFRKGAMWAWKCASPQSSGEEIERLKAEAKALDEGWERERKRMGYYEPDGIQKKILNLEVVLSAKDREIERLHRLREPMIKFYRARGEEIRSLRTELAAEKLKVGKLREFIKEIHENKSESFWRRDSLLGADVAKLLESTKES